MRQRGQTRHPGKMGEGRIHRQGRAGAKALRQDGTSEQIKGCAVGEPGGREKDMGKTTFLYGHGGVVKTVMRFQAHIGPEYSDGVVPEKLGSQKGTLMADSSQ